MKKRDRPKHIAKPPDLIRDTLHIFTDGSCNLHDTSGGWAAILLWNGETKELYGGARGQTNNTMELTGILRGLEARKKDVRTIIYTDSQYAINSLVTWYSGWERKGFITSTGKPVANLPLLKAIRERMTPMVVFQWVRGHVGITYNERADELAGQGRREFGVPVKPSPSLES
jgi:ribonuclease HI